jgi:Zn-dependent protease
MLIGVPENTAYDLRFRLFGIPVRVHPFFWIVTLLLGSRGAGGADTMTHILIWVGCVFVSILVHEFGHALMAWFFGSNPSVVLYGMGGLCYYDDIDRQGPWQRVAVLICGPGAGFLFLGSVVGAYFALGTPALSPQGKEILIVLAYVNIFWGLVNLLPIWPMDGGQISVTILSMINRRNGRRWGHVVSLLAAGCLAVWLVTIQQYWPAFLAGYFAFSNYQVLEAMRYSSSHFDDYGSGRW